MVRRLLVICSYSLVVVVLSVLLAAPSAAGGLGPYLPPVPDPIVLPFQQPNCTWCPGNRGVDYFPVPGAVVRASNSGRVSFAGVVAHVVYVVLTHPDGLRTTYGDLSSMSVGVGQWVAAGAPVGLASAHLHFGVRMGDRYLDPELLFAGRLHRARLVPVSVSGAPGRGSLSLSRPIRAESMQRPVPIPRSPFRARGRLALTAGEGDHDHGRRDHEAAARRGGALRAPDPPLEPEDEAVHLRRARWHLHHRPRPDAGADRDRLHLRA